MEGIRPGAYPEVNLLERRRLSMKTILRSDNLSCPSCIAKIEKALMNVRGVQEARVHFNTGRIEVQHDPATVSADDLAKAVRSIGYEARVSAF